MPAHSPTPAAGELPPGLDVLWGRRERGRRGPQSELSVERIVAAAMELADADGLAAVSMAGVAKRLGFTTMSLYRHVTSKDELLQLMWNASAEGAQSLVLTGRGWRPRLREWAQIQRDLLDQHPWITQLPMATPPLAPNSLAFVELGLTALDGADLADADKLRALGLLSSYTLSEARMAHDARLATAAAGAPPPQFETVLRLVVDADTYPRLHRIAWAPGDPTDEYGSFLAGIDCILDGVEALSRRNRRARARRGAPGTRS
ncbi:transcriptional regulator, TetR family [Jatrophihabitans endophyticus]|uniref:Transcriptional regulator, TetR family n=1 Tax=Jatrophihabitans endophyticus TaxID=1206085 RepID=A0A1M5DF47_9ACTN|nr:TetR/AcrR family transcriptional regulator [Jatrophihabitans endophyticus]SHF65683.1 transcriptional regulator, TetR family [Jatrophihabitans endophyticus]